MKYTSQIERQGRLWVNVTRQTSKELSVISKKFNFWPVDVEESRPPFQRSKIVKRPDYYFMVLHFPVFDRESRRLGFTEVDFFLSANYLVTVHDNKLTGIGDFFNECRLQPEILERYFNGTMAQVLFELLSRLLEAIFPILLHVNEDINSVDRKLFGQTPGKEMAEEILRLKTNIVTFRRTMQGHRAVMERLILYSGRELDLASYQSYINSLREFTAEIWQMLESQKESINALHETNESLLSLRTTQVMKTLTVISVVTFPLTLLATIFAVRAEGTPFIDLPYGFWMLLGLIVVGAASMVTIFKKRRWL